MTVCKPRRKYAFLRDPLNGWGEAAAGGLDIVELPLHPGAIFAKPFVQVLAEKLRENLDQAFSGQSEPVESEFVLK
jgi:hypothetical protein